MTDVEIEVLVELWEITSYRDRCVYDTKYVKDVWVSPDAPPPEDHQYVSLSSARIKDMLEKKELTIRLKKGD